MRDSLQSDDLEAICSILEDEKKNKIKFQMASLLVYLQDLRFIS